MKPIVLEEQPYTIHLYGEEDSRGIVYCPLSPQQAEEVWGKLDCPRPVLAAISGVDWNRELSPWAGPEVFRGGGAFGGEAGAFLAALTGRILPRAEAALGKTPSWRGIAGYSLAGLFALWALQQTSCFQRAASCSGSLWYDGYLEYLKSHPLGDGLEQVYLSLGDREKRTKNPRMAAVEDCTLQAAAWLEGQGIPVVFQWNAGGHFQEVPGRIARGIAALAAGPER